jgi:hypothetical protein
MLLAHYFASNGNWALSRRRLLRRQRWFAGGVCRARSGTAVLFWNDRLALIPVQVCKRCGVRRRR